MHLGTWCDSWACPVQSRQVDFSDPCGSPPSQDILWFYYILQTESSHFENWKLRFSSLLCCDPDRGMTGLAHKLANKLVRGVRSLPTCCWSNSITHTQKSEEVKSEHRRSHLYMQKTYMVTCKSGEGSFFLMTLTDVWNSCSRRNAFTDKCSGFPALLLLSCFRQSA